MLIQDLIKVCIAVLSAWIVACVSGQACRAKYAIHQICPTSSGQVLRDLNKLSVVSCGLMCDVDDLCRSFVYSPATKVCKTYVEGWLGVSFSCNSGDRVAHGVIESGTSCLGSWLGDPCQGDPDCPIPNSGCSSGTCQCHTGFSVRRKSNDCVGDCPTPGYGSWWTQEDVYLTLNAQMTETATSPEGCQEHCHMQTTFVCRRIEYMDTDCQLFNETAFTQPGAVQPLTEPTWFAYLRNCY